MNCLACLSSRCSCITRLTIRVPTVPSHVITTTTLLVAPCAVPIPVYPRWHGASFSRPPGRSLTRPQSESNAAHGDRLLLPGFDSAAEDG
jgi:hypothetical protein